jgi:hypothetical protein
MGHELHVRCSSCGRGGAGRVGQTVVSNQLRWYRSTSCVNCGHVEEDAIGFPPAPLRDLFLKEGGHWQLTVSEADRVAAIRVVRTALGFLLEEAAAVSLRRFPAVYVGTRTEVEWLKARMDASGVGSQIAESGER